MIVYCALVVLTPVKDEMGFPIFCNNGDTLLSSMMYHLDIQEIRILPSLSMEICNPFFVSSRSFTVDTQTCTIYDDV